MSTGEPQNSTGPEAGSDVDDWSDMGDESSYGDESFDEYDYEMDADESQTANEILNTSMNEPIRSHGSQEQHWNEDSFADDQLPLFPTPTPTSGNSVQFLQESRPSSTSSPRAGHRMTTSYRGTLIVMESGRQGVELPTSRWGEPPAEEDIWQPSADVEVTYTMVNPRDCILPQHPIIEDVYHDVNFVFCAICTDEVEVWLAVCSPCRHEFCERCALRLVAQTGYTDCPFCRHGLHRSDFLPCSLRPGDQIYYLGAGGLHMAEHHGIYVGRGEVVHLANNWGDRQAVPGASGRSGSSGALFGAESNSVVERCTLVDFQRHARDRNSRVFRKQYSRDQQSRRPREVITMAEGYVGRPFGRYSLFYNNCEHFASYCKTGTSESPQAEVALRVIAATAFGAALIGPLAGACLGAFVVYNRRR